MSRLLFLVVAGLLIALVQMWVKYIRVPIGRVELRSTQLRIAGPCTRQAGMVKAVDVCRQHVVVYPSHQGMRNTLALQRRAKEAGCAELLNPVLARGRRYIVYPRCEPMSERTLPRDWAQQIDRLTELIAVGVTDFHGGNIMVCDGQLKLIDQDDTCYINGKPLTRPDGLLRLRRGRVELPMVTTDVHYAHTRLNQLRRSVAKKMRRAVSEPKPR
jgi:hypothetical protein